MSSAHAWTLASWLGSVSPFSDAIVPTVLSTTGSVLASRHREQGLRPRCKEMRSRATGARPSLRRPVLHWRVDHTDLLPPHLSGKARQVAKRRVLPDCSCRRARRFPPLLAVSTRDGARDACLARVRGDGLTRTATHRPRVPGRWQARRGSRRHARDDDPTFAPTVRAARRCAADRGRSDSASSARQAVGGRDDDADVLDRVRGGVRERSAIQRRVSRRVSTAANGRSQDEPWAWLTAARGSDTVPIRRSRSCGEPGGER